MSLSRPRAPTPTLPSAPCARTLPDQARGQLAGPAQRHGSREAVCLRPDSVWHAALGWQTGAQQSQTSRYPQEDCGHPPTPDFERLGTETAEDRAQPEDRQGPLGLGGGRAVPRGPQAAARGMSALLLRPRWPDTRRLQVQLCSRTRPGAQRTSAPSFPPSSQRRAPVRASAATTAPAGRQEPPGAGAGPAGSR